MTPVRCFLLPAAPRQTPRTQRGQPPPPGSPAGSGSPARGDTSPVARGHHGRADTSSGVSDPPSTSISPVLLTAVGISSTRIHRESHVWPQTPTSSTKPEGPASTYLWFCQKLEELKKKFGCLLPRSNHYGEMKAFQSMLRETEALVGLVHPTVGQLYFRHPSLHPLKRQAHVLLGMEVLTFLQASAEPSRPTLALPPRAALEESRRRGRGGRLQEINTAAQGAGNTSGLLPTVSTSNY